MDVPSFVILMNSYVGSCAETMERQHRQQAINGIKGIIHSN